MPLAINFHATRSVVRSAFLQREERRLERAFARHGETCNETEGCPLSTLEDVVRVAIDAAILDQSGENTYTVTNQCLSAHHPL